MSVSAGGVMSAQAMAKCLVRCFALFVLAAGPLSGSAADDKEAQSESNDAPRTSNGGSLFDGAVEILIDVDPAGSGGGDKANSLVRIMVGSGRDSEAAGENGNRPANDAEPGKDGEQAAAGASRDRPRPDGSATADRRADRKKDGEGKPRKGNAASGEDDEDAADLAKAEKEALGRIAGTSQKGLENAQKNMADAVNALDEGLGTDQPPDWDESDLVSTEP